jgi:hypothetical protein
MVAQYQGDHDLDPGPLRGASEDGLGQPVEPAFGSEQVAGLKAPMGDEDQGSAEGNESNRLMHTVSFHSFKKEKGAGIAHRFAKKSEFSPKGP